MATPSDKQKTALMVALQAAVKAAEVMTKIWNSRQLRAKKGGKGKDLVTRADLGAEQIILAIIREHWTEPFIVLSEQDNATFDMSTLGNQTLWIVDAINGSVNYTRGDPHCAISIAVVWDQAVQVSVVSAPFEQQTFYALRGHGAYLDNKRIRCSEVKRMNRSLIFVGFPMDPELQSAEQAARRVATILPRTLGVRCYGSSALALCRVACGRAEGFFDSAKPWEVAAASHIARESGVTVGSFRTAQRVIKGLEAELRSDCLLAACPGIYPELEMLLGSSQWKGDAKR